MDERVGGWIEEEIVGCIDRWMDPLFPIVIDYCQLILKLNLSQVTTPKTVRKFSSLDLREREG